MPHSNRVPQIFQRRAARQQPLRQNNRARPSRVPAEELAAPSRARMRVEVLVLPGDVEAEGGAFAGGSAGVEAADEGVGVDGVADGGGVATGEGTVGECGELHLGAELVEPGAGDVHAHS